ncbi:dual specificity protein phosphatase Mpk3 isoform X2 [Anopheles moucheti]|uniref:dual specificity protein phosphatase Mpk3 isoform X2 n=1 Tax=Anopheles moucheti TaxID=186751 RepID=UPI0022F10401|nr:dual specificity protein phosphatase Mpk3 isoform X2 [Anopheles moucheti]
MPDHDIEMITSEQLHAALRKSQKHFIILDCRSSHEYTESHIRTAVNFSIPSIMLRRFAAGKIDITSTIKCRDLKERILSCYKESTFVLYNNSNEPVGDGGGGREDLALLTGGGCSGLISTTTATAAGGNDTTINVLHRKLKQDGCRVVCLEGGYANFRQSFPEWCEDEVINANLQTGCAATEQLMGLRSLRISIPFSDSACSSSTESSDCESSTNYLSESAVSVEPVEILPGLFLGNASHSEDLKSLKKYNIKYILNVTPDLPNVFERDGQIRYLQIPITDHWSQAGDLANHFPDAIKFIDEARTNGCGVLVHCLAGVSRSVTVTLAYLMFARTLSLNDAFLLVRSRKPDVSPNFHFMQQLHSFEQQLNIDPTQSYNCACVEVECKCTQAAIDLLGPFTTGISPDSGIEFDRWTPSSNTPK